MKKCQGHQIHGKFSHGGIDINNYCGIRILKAYDDKIIILPVFARLDWVVRIRKIKRNADSTTVKPKLAPSVEEAIQQSCHGGQYNDQTSSNFDTKKVNKTQRTVNIVKNIPRNRARDYGT